VSIPEPWPHLSAVIYLDRADEWRQRQELDGACNLLGELYTRACVHSWRAYRVHATLGLPVIIYRVFGLSIPRPRSASALFYPRQRVLPRQLVPPTETNLE